MSKASLIFLLLTILGVIIDLSVYIYAKKEIPFYQKHKDNINNNSHRKSIYIQLCALCNSIALHPIKYILLFSIFLLSRFFKLYFFQIIYGIILIFNFIESIRFFDSYSMIKYSRISDDLK